MSTQAKHVLSDYEIISNDQSLINEGCKFLSIRLSEEGQNIIGKNRLHNPVCLCVAIIQLELTGIYSSNYQNNKYKVDILIPMKYPFAPPYVIFHTPIDHINICNLSGLVTHSFLGSEWSPMGLRLVIIEILQLFTVPRPQDIITENQLIKDKTNNSSLPIRTSFLNDLDSFDF